MKIRDYRGLFNSELTPIFEAEEAESFFYLILENRHKLKRIDLALNPDLVFSDEEIRNWNIVLEQLKEQVPVQYILGETSFYGLEFEVNNNVLIPRPETEELVQWIIDEDLRVQRLKKIKILDIGTGSGCIAVSLAKNIPNVEVFAIDVSKEALAIAQKNAQKNGVEVVFLERNILETADLEQEFDIIVSNPPYVRFLEKEEIKKNVLDYEPHLALFVKDEDPLIFYRKIAQLAQKNLSEKGKLYFEINQYLGKEMVDLLEKMNFKNVELRKDIYGNERMIKADLF